MNSILIFVVLMWAPSITITCLALCEHIRESVQDRRMRKRLEGYGASSFN